MYRECFILLAHDRCDFIIFQILFKLMENSNGNLVTYSVCEENTSECVLGSVSYEKYIIIIIYRIVNFILQIIFIARASHASRTNEYKFGLVFVCLCVRTRYWEKITLERKINIDIRWRINKHAIWKKKKLKKKPNMNLMQIFGESASQHPNKRSLQFHWNIRYHLSVWRFFFFSFICLTYGCSLLCAFRDAISACVAIWQLLAKFWIAKRAPITCHEIWIQSMPTQTLCNASARMWMQDIKFWLIIQIDVRQQEDSNRGFWLER